MYKVKRTWCCLRLVFWIYWVVLPLGPRVGQGNCVPGLTVFSVWLGSSFLAFFLCSIGGALPIVFAYFSEFLSREKRGEHLSWLGIFWMTGGIYASAMAWSIIPHYGECRQLQRAEGPSFPDTCVCTSFPVLSLNPTLSHTVPVYNLDLSKERPSLETHC